MTKKILLIILMLSMITVAAFGCMRPNGTPADTDDESVTPTAEAIEPEPEVSTYCFFGLDNRSADDKGRSDVIMLVRADNEAEDIRVVSVYRDTLMDIGGLTKANGAYEYGGPFYAVDMLEKNLDIDIDGYVSAEFIAVIDMIDRLGGITLDITDEEAEYANAYIREMNEMYDRHSRPLKGGTWNLDGVQAVGYARVRYTEGWDYKRTERQRTVLSLMIDKFRNADDETQNAVLDTFFSDFYTDMTEAEVSNMADHILSYSFSETAGYPKYRKGVSVAGLGSCVAPKDMNRNVKWLHEFLYGETGYTPSEDISLISSEITSITGE